MIEQVAVFNSLRAMALTEREIMLGLSYPPGEFERWLRSGAPAIPQRLRHERARDSSEVAA
jgi:hypothetical protein